MTGVLFLFKLIYINGPRRYCAHINHSMKFQDLKKFLEYWILKSHNLQYQPITFYWIDYDGDKFAVSTEDEYHIFEIKHPMNGILWATSDYIEHVLPEDRIDEDAWNVYFRHQCDICFRCNRSNEFAYNEYGLMRCVFCNFDRGHCCAYAVEGSLLPRDAIQTPTLPATKINKALQNKIETLVNGDKDDKEAYGNKEVDYGNKNDKENDYYDDTDNETSTVSSTVYQSSITRSTGAIPKRSKTENDKLSPHVENAVQVMKNMGFTDDNGWLTRLLVSTNGKISEALDMINPAPKVKRSTSSMKK